MAATSTLTLRVKAIGERSIDAITRKLAKLSAATMAYSSVSTSSLTATDVKWKKHFDGVDKGIKAFGGALTKFVTMGAKFAALQVGVLGLAMVALHASFVLGNAAMKAFRFAATGAAGAAAGLAAAASIAAAAVREQQIAMYSYKGGGNYQSASVAMRALAADADLATVGAAGLNAVFAEVSKTSTFSAGSQNLLKGLMDFASAGKPLEEGAKSAGKLIAAMQDPKGSFTKMKAAAKELGPEMEKAIKDLGITSSDELKKAIMDGTLAAAGGVDGQFGRVNDTLVNRFKSSFALIKNDFADFGDPLLEPTKKMFEGVVKIFNNAFGRVAGDIAAFAQGGMFGDMEGIIGKLADFFVNFMRDYLPKVQGMMDGMGGWWDRFKDGWNMVLDKLRPLIDGARVLEETFMKVFRPVGQALSDGFGDFNQQILDNKDDFFAFGDSIGRFIAVMSKYAKTVREIFIDALPFLTKIINGLTGIVDLFMSLLGGFRSLLGGGGMGSFMLLATMLSGGRAAKKTTGGFVASYKSNITPFGAGSGPLTGQTGQGNVTEAGRARAGRLGDAVKSQSVRSMTVSRMIVRSTGGPMGQNDPRVQAQVARSEARKEADALRSKTAEGVAKKQAAIAQKEAADKAAATRATAQVKYDKATGLEKAKAARALRQADKALLQARQGSVTLPQLGMGPATYKNNAFTRNFRMTAQARAEMLEAHAAATGMTPGIGTKTRAGMQKIRQAREGYAYKRMFGGDIGTKNNPRVVKGINNTMGASMGASVALGLAAKLAPESAQGALALGSMVSMVNPLAGLAVGVVGGLVMGIRGAAEAKKKEARAAATKEASAFADEVMGKFGDGIQNALDTDTFSATTVEKEQQKMLDKYTQKKKGLAEFVEGAGEDMLNKRGKASLAAGEGNVAVGDFNTGWGRWVSAIKNVSNFVTGKDFAFGEGARFGMGDVGIGGIGFDTEKYVQGTSDMAGLMKLDQAGVDVFDEDKFKEAAKKQRMSGVGHFAEMDQGTYDMAMANIEEYWTTAIDMAEADSKALEMIVDYGQKRIPILGTALNKTEEEVYRLANTIGFDLYDSSISTTEQLKKLSEAMISTKRDMDIASQDRFAAGTDVFRKQKDSLEAKEALNEGSFALRGQFNEGTLDESTLMDFYENKRQQLVAYYKGDVQLAESEFNRAYGPGGTMYNVVGGALEGMEPAIMALAGDELTQVGEESRLARESNLTEFITAKALGGSEATTVSGDVAGLSGVLASNQALSTNFQTYLETIDLGTKEGQESLQAWLDASPSLEDFELKFEKFTTPADAAFQALKDAGDGLNEAADRLNPPADAASDTRTPRGPIGDATSRNLGTTLSNHSAVNGSIPGKRNITSGYRNYALGSLKSDHVTGRALDMVGDNLVSYRDKMTAAGGLAEFHGKGDARHLHVVPPSRSLGDSMTAVSATSSTVTAERGGQTVSNSNNFYITGSNPQEIANAVIAKMAMINKSNGERR